MRTLQLRRARHTASGRQKAGWAQTWAPQCRWQTQTPLTPLRHTLPRDAHPREELRDSRSWQSLDPAHLSSQGSLFLLPSMDGSPSSIRTLLRGREDVAGRDRKKQEELLDMYQMPAPGSDLQPKPLPLASTSPPSAGGPWTEARGTSSSPGTPSKHSTPELDHAHQGQGSSHPGHAPTWPPPTMLLPHGGAFQWGCPGSGKGRRF